MTMMAAALLAACVAVEGDRITAADLARADAAFASLAPDVTVGYAPAPGVRRIMSPGETAALAARHGIKREGDGGLCFMRAAGVLTEAKLIAAMHETFGSQAVHLEITEISNFPAPEGEIVFPAAGLAKPAGDAPVLWRGHVRYAGGRRFAIWARVRVSGAVRRITAVTDLEPGKPITPESVKEELHTGFVRPGTTAQSLGDVTGRIPRSRIPAGSHVLPETLNAVREVERGEPVTVQVRCGAARLRLDAVASSDGARGEVVVVRNPSSGKTFRARVTGKSMVIVEGAGCV